MSNMTLFELASEHRALAERLTDLELDEDTIRDTLESESMALEVKASNVAKIIRSLDVLGGSIKEAEQQMAARRQRYERRSAWLKAYLLGAMQLSGMKKIEGPMLCISVRKNPESVVIPDVSAVPAEFMRAPPPPPPAPDKTAIKEALKAGLACDWARLEAGERLEIK